MQKILVFAVVLFLAIVVNGQPPELSIVGDRALDKVSLVAYSGSEFEPLLAKPEFKDLRPFALLLRNDSENAIVALTIRWTIYRRASQKEEVLDYRTDSLFVNPEPVVRPKSQLLVTPGLMLPEHLANSGFAARGPKIDRIEDITLVTVSLDTVVLQGGRVLGPDNSGTLEMIRARKLAADSVVSEVNNAISKGVDKRTAVASLPAVNDGAERSDFSFWRSRIIQSLKMSRDLDRSLARLASVPIPPLNR